VITQWAQTNFLITGGGELADVTPAVIKSDLLNGRIYTQHIHHDGEGEPLLELWMIDQMGHTWSGGNPDGSYTDPAGPNASEIIWNFFNQQQHSQQEEEQPDTNSIETISIPVEQRVEPQAQPLPEPEPESDSEPEAKPEPEPEAPSEPQSDSPNEASIEVPKRNFFSTFFSKFGKKNK